MSINVKIVPNTQTVQPGVGADGKVNTPTITETGKAEIRKIPGMTEYDPESGTVVPRKGWGSATPQDSKNEVKDTLGSPLKEVEKQEEQGELSRHDKWKADQKAKREAKEQSQQEKAIKQQALARDFLRQGNLVEAAKALGMEPQEFALYAQNAMLSIPTKEKEEKKLTAEEQRTQEIETLKAELNRLNQEKAQEKFEGNAAKWINENMDPVLADKDKFEFINKGEINKIKRAAYDYMNKVYAESCTWNNQENKWNNDGQVLNVADVLETIEKQFEEAASAALERNRDIKKLAKFYAPKEQESIIQDAPEVRTTSKATQDSPIDEARQAAKSLQEQLQSRVAQNGGNLRVSSNGSSGKPFALMTAYEKSMYFKNGGN